MLTKEYVKKELHGDKVIVTRRGEIKVITKQIPDISTINNFCLKGYYIKHEVNIKSLNFILTLMPNGIFKGR